MKNPMTIMKPFFCAVIFATISSTANAAKLLPAAGVSNTVKPASAVSGSSTPTTVASVQATSVSHASESPAQPAPAVFGGSGMYVGAQLGDSSVGLLLGYRISKMFSMEFSYDYLDPIYTSITIRERTRLNASGIALFPIKFSLMGPMALYIKVGYGRSTEKFTVNDPGIPVPPATTTITTTSSSGVTGGAGVHVDLSNSTSARLGVTVVGSEKTTYLAAIYKF